MRKNKGNYALLHNVSIKGTVAKEGYYSKNGKEYNFLVIEDKNNNVIRCTAKLKTEYLDLEMHAGDQIHILVKIKRRKYIRSEKMNIIDANVVEII